MNSMSIFNSVQFDKAVAMFCYNRLVGKLLCLVELCGALVILSWCSSTLPLALRFFRHISAFFAGHLFFFILSNAIILTLLVKSCWLSDRSPPSPGGANNAESDLYEELMNNSTSDTSTSISGIHGHTQEVLFQDKEMISKAEVPVSPAGIENDVADESADFAFAKDFRRTKSEVTYYSEKSASKGAVLRRSETETYCREIVSAAECGGDENLVQEEEISNEEFQRTIEAFIAKQLKFRRQESIRRCCPNV